MRRSCYICGAGVSNYELCETCYTATTQYQFSNEAFQEPTHLRREYKALLKNITGNPKNIFIEYLFELEAMAKVLRFRFDDHTLDDRVRDDILVLRRNFEIKSHGRHKVQPLKEDDNLEDSRVEIGSQSAFRCNDGHFVRSMLERYVDNWLYREFLVHAYSTKVVLPLTPGRDLISTFYLPEGNVYIEVWEKDEDDGVKEFIRQAYQKNRLNYIEVEEMDTARVSSHLAESLSVHFPKRKFL